MRNVRTVITPSSDCSEVYLPASLHKGSRTLHICAVFDTGCAVSVIPAGYVATSKPCDLKLVAANNSEISVAGAARVNFSVNGVKFFADVLCSEAVDEFLLGSDWLKQNKCIWDFASSEITIRGHVFKLQSRKSCVHVRRVYVSDNVVVQKHSVADIPVRLRYTSLHCPAMNWILEPRLVDGQLLTPRSLLGNDEQAFVRVINPLAEDVMVRKNLCIGTAEPVKFQCDKCGPVCFCVPTDSEEKTCLPVRTVETVNQVVEPELAHAVDGITTNLDSCKGDSIVLNDMELIKPMLDSLPDFISAEQRKQVETLLLQYVDIFARFEYDVGCTSLMQHRLELADPTLPPVREHLRI